MRSTHYTGVVLTPAVPPATHDWLSAMWMRGWLQQVCHGQLPLLAAAETRGVDEIIQEAWDGKGICNTVGGDRVCVWGGGGGAVYFLKSSNRATLTIVQALTKISFLSVRASLHVVTCRSSRTLLFLSLLIFPPFF